MTDVQHRGMDIDHSFQRISTLALPVRSVTGLSAGPRGRRLSVRRCDLADFIGGSVMFEDAVPVSGPETMDQLHEMAGRPTAGVRDVLRDVQGDVLVLGAGGKMGLHVAAMVQRGFRELGQSNRVIAVSRFGNAAARKPFDKFEIETMSADLTDDAALAALPESAAVFFLAGVKFGACDDAALLHRMNVELPGRVARRFCDSRIVALSTGCVYSYVTPASGGSVETDPTAPVGPYANSCLGRERAFVDSGVRCCLIRLNYSVDLQYGVPVDVAQRVLNGLSIDVSMGYANFIWQGDAVATTIQALQLCASPAAVLNVTGVRIMAIRDMAEWFGNRFGCSVTITGSEAPTAWLNNAARACALFGPPSVDEQTLLQWVADWLESGGPTHGKPTHFEVRDGKF